ncbi:MAG: hypothetical protein O3C40_25345 [Planctomycetota bacterium]|nr:hypothetical protein [Planctomycetota bacterium]
MMSRMFALSVAVLGCSLWADEAMAASGFAVIDNISVLHSAGPDDIFNTDDDYDVVTVDFQARSNDDDADVKIFVNEAGIEVYSTVICIGETLDHTIEVEAGAMFIVAHDDEYEITVEVRETSGTLVATISASEEHP